MSEQTYTLPGMADWSFSVPKLQHRGGAGFNITNRTTPQEIAEAVRNILRGTTLTPDESAFEVVAQAAMNIDWQALFNPYPIPVAPLLNAAPVASAQNTISPALVDELCEHLKAVYYPLQKLKGV